MIKILILIAIIVLTTLVGVFLASGKKKRMQVFSELYRFNENLILNLRFDRAPVKKVAEEFRYLPRILDGEPVLQGSDAEFVKEYASNLGKSDALSQIDYLNGRKAALEKLKNESAGDYKKYGSLYLKIFFMVGVLMAVLMA